ncbi:hypothetical protein OVA24_14845 [Luteolibacter sp. SL250]|uniref:hypothetical protein n=1 Tax=Luteolibacter sp. SL250 TaxID=2995170 RepID=UPI00226EC87A|nr:hypothetical protein [Luteolibacter sp. SL250]WAC18510.1 hypothetical protein OVA24_14845 [Luteolibacter sp. SL250]
MQTGNSGRRMFAFLFALIAVAPFVTSLAVSVLPSTAVLVCAFPTAWFLSRHDGKRWIISITVAGLLGGGLLGHLLEDMEGIVVGSLIGLVSGAVVGWGTLRLLKILPDKWGVLTGWSLLGIAFTLVPLLAGIRLLTGKIDDDESPFILLAIAYGVLHGARKGWWEHPLSWQRVWDAVMDWLRFWSGWRAFPWVAAFLIAYLTAGPVGEHYSVEEGENLSIRLLAVSYVWPVLLSVAALVSLAASSKGRNFRNPLHVLLCGVVLVLSAHSMIRCARHHVFVSPTHLEVRGGLWKSIHLSRADATEVREEPLRGRRVSSSFPVIITRDGKEHSLRDIPDSHLIESYLVERWKLPHSPLGPR